MTVHDETDHDEIEIPVRTCPWCGELECGPAAHAYAACGECGRFSSPDDPVEDVGTGVDDQVALLLAIVVRPVEDGNDFVDLALTGEELRRALALEGGGSAHARDALAQYEDALFDASDHAPGGLRADLEAAFAALAGAERVDEDVLAGPDEVLMVAAGAARAAVLADSEAVELGHLARDLAAALAPTLRPEWWQLAEARSMMLGPDPEFIGLYDWLDMLGELAESRLDTGMALH